MKFRYLGPMPGTGTALRLLIAEKLYAPGPKTMDKQGKSFVFALRTFVRWRRLRS